MKDSFFPRRILSDTTNVLCVACGSIGMIPDQAWQESHQVVVRPATMDETMGTRQRVQGCPDRPYAR